jgi:uncharacterized protein YndB with AHSA1/START domain
VITTELVLRIEVAASPKTVFRFLSDPLKFKMWMGRESTISPEEGGALAVSYPNGDLATGTIEEVVLDERIVFTWGYRDSAHTLAPGSTRVTITVEAVAHGSVVTLRHEGLPTDGLRRNHMMGWRHYLALLSDASSNEHLARELHDRMKAYFEAWNESDGPRRDALLERCWSNTGRYLDRFTYVTGRGDLSEVIGMARAIQPDARLELRGAPQLSHGFLRFQWVVKDSSDSTLGSGSSFGQLAADGRFLSVVGFWDPPPSPVPGPAARREEP